MYGKKFFRTLFVVTYMVPPYVGAMAWLRLLNPNAGVLNRFLMKIFGLGTAPFNIYTTSGIVWVLTCFFYPYAFITISRAMEKMDPSLEEASRISGASPLKTLLKVTIPMMTPSIIAAGLLVFVASASSYGIPSIIGAPGQIYTVTMRIIDFVHIGSEEGLTDAMTLAVFLMLISNIILYISTFVVGRKQYITMSGKSTRPNIVELGKMEITYNNNNFNFFIFCNNFTIYNSCYNIIYCKYGKTTYFIKFIIKSLGKSFFKSFNYKFNNKQFPNSNGCCILWNFNLLCNGISITKNKYKRKKNPRLFDNIRFWNTKCNNSFGTYNINEW